MEITYDEARTKQIMFRVGDADYELINEIAKKRKIGQGTVVRGLVEAALREVRKKPQEEL